MRAVNGIGVGPESSEISGYPATHPTRPLNINATTLDGLVLLTWEYPNNDGGYPVESYEVQLNSGGDWIPVSLSQSYNFTGLENGQSYEFNVRAINRVGDGGVGSVNGVPATRPAAPTLTASRGGDASVALTWSEPDNGGRTIREYQYRKVVNNAGSWVRLSRGYDEFRCDPQYGFCKWYLLFFSGESCK